MSGFLSTIGVLAFLGGIGTAIYWVVTRVRKRSNKRFGWTALALIVIGFILVGANTDDSSSSSAQQDHQSASMANHKASSNHKTSTKKRQTTKKTAAKPVNHSAILAKLVSYTNAESAGPTGDYYYKVGHARLNHFAGMKRGDAKFASDSQGRPTTARAVLTYNEYASSRGSRQGSPLDPMGWPADNPKTTISYADTGRTYHGYLWNRSHSIGDSLLGAKSYSSENNFTTGTRPQNVGATQNGGMRVAEETVEGYWESNEGTKQTVSYQTTPVYKGSEIIPRGSIVDIKSSDGQLNVEYVIINSAEGIKINYSNGTSNAKPYSKPATNHATSHQATVAAAPARHRSSSQSSQGRSTTATATVSGGWSTAPAGMVYVSDSNKYYQRVKTPANYTYETESQAKASGAVRAARGNQYARPY